MSLNIITDFENNIAILRLQGDLIVSEVEKLRNEFREVMKKNIHKIILDFSDIEFIDSSGIGLMVEILKSVKKFDDGQLKLINLNKQVKDILKQIQLYSIFEIYDSEDEAIESLQ